ncbi:MAG: hypothetical protein KOO63_13140 [Bacteroidales bacterium]|nr:hypothetical protein [Candidatus Latescibacterota bacterium]
MTRRIFILLLLGIFFSSQQVSSGNIFVEERNVDLKESVIGEVEFSEGPELNYLIPVGTDSIQVMEIEIPQEKDTGMVKEIAMVAIVATFAFYIIYSMFYSSEDEEVDDGGGGKELPTSIVAGTISL